MTHTKKGIYHDLNGIYERVNRAYFDEKIEAKIQWGKRSASRGRFRSIRLGSYNHDRKLITIHPIMDQASIPRICVERIVHHEMLHQIHPIKRGKAGRRLIHTADFRQDEKQFLEGEIADLWFKSNLDRILRNKVS